MNDPHELVLSFKMELKRIIDSRTRPMAKLMAIDRLTKSYKPLLLDERLSQKNIKLFFELHRRTVNNLK